MARKFLNRVTAAACQQRLYGSGCIAMLRNIYISNNVNNKNVSFNIWLYLNLRWCYNYNKSNIT